MLHGATIDVLHMRRVGEGKDGDVEGSCDIFTDDRYGRAFIALDWELANVELRGYSRQCTSVGTGVEDGQDVGTINEFAIRLRLQKETM